MKKASSVLSFDQYLNEEKKVYGHKAITDLEKTLDKDHDIYLDDTTGELSGTVVSKIEYLTRMLKDAVKKKDLSKVDRAIGYIETKMKM